MKTLEHLDDWAKIQCDCGHVFDVDPHTEENLYFDVNCLRSECPKCGRRETSQSYYWTQIRWVADKQIMWMYQPKLLKKYKTIQMISQVFREDIERVVKDVIQIKESK